MKHLAEKIKQSIVEKLGVTESQLTSDASFKDDLGADSLDVYELLVELEKEFKLTIADEEAEKLTTVGALINYINLHAKVADAVVV